MEFKAQVWENGGPGWLLCQEGQEEEGDQGLLQGQHGHSGQEPGGDGAKGAEQTGATGVLPARG